MAKYYVLREEVEAQVVNESYLGSLPRMGGNPQRVKDSAEIHGPRGEKSYAAMDDYVVKVGDMFLAVPKGIFLAMFCEVDDTIEEEPQPVNPTDPLTTDGQDSTPSQPTQNLDEASQELAPSGLGESLQGFEDNETGSQPVPFVEADFPFPEE